MIRRIKKRFHLGIILAVVICLYFIQSEPMFSDSVKMTVTVPGNMISGSGTTGDCGKGDWRVDVKVCPVNSGCKGPTIQAGQGHGLNICHELDEDLGPYYVQNISIGGAVLYFNAITVKKSTATFEVTDSNQTVRTYYLYSSSDLGSASMVIPSTNLISGNISDIGGNPVPGVTVSTNSGYSAVSDANGNYEMKVQSPGTYTLTPILLGRTFNPTSRTVAVPPDSTDQNFQLCLPVISVNPSSLNFYNVNVGNSYSEILTISNTGNDTLKISSISLSGIDAAEFSYSPKIGYTGSIPVGENQELEVLFSPTSQGAKTAAITLSHNAPGSPTGIPLTGVGTCEVNTNGAVRFAQANMSKWGGDPYGCLDCNPTTISADGCALTSLVMALNIQGIPNSVLDPGKANSALQNIPWQSMPACFSNSVPKIHCGYSCRKVLWDFDTRLLGALFGNTCNLKFSWAVTHSEADLEKMVCQDSRAVITGVKTGYKLTKNGTVVGVAPSHYVLVIGKEGSRFKIWDPSSRNYQYLDQYYNLANTPVLFQTRGYVRDPINNSSLMITSSNGVDFLVKDPTGKTAGYSPDDNTIYQNIPDGAYVLDSFENDDCHQINAQFGVYAPVQGDYSVTFSTDQPTLFQVKILSFAQDGSIQEANHFSVIIDSNSNPMIEVNFNPLPGQSCIIKRIADFNSIKLDIQSAYSLDRIDNNGIVNALTKKIEHSKDAYDNGNIKKSLNIMAAFVSHVEAQKGKHIDEDVAIVLIEDAQFIIDTLNNSL